MPCRALPCRGVLVTVWHRSQEPMSLSTKCHLSLTARPYAVADPAAANAGTVDPAKIDMAVAELDMITDVL